MNLSTVTLGLVFTAGIATYTIAEFEPLYKAVNEIEYETLEDVKEGMSIKEAIDIVNRNNQKRKDLILKLKRAVNENLKEKAEEVEE